MKGIKIWLGVNCRIFSSGGMNKILAHGGLLFSAGGEMGECPSRENPDL